MRRSDLWPRVVLVAVSLGIVAGAFAQTTEQRRTLKTWHDQIVRAQTPPQALLTRQAQQYLRSEAPALDTLSAPYQGQLLRLRTYVGLLTGEVDAARAAYAKLEQRFPGDQGTVRTAWTLATATGDAQLAEKVLKMLAEKGWARDEQLATRRQRLKRIGEAFPQRSLKLQSGRALDISRERGTVFLLDFWQAGSDREAEQLQALQDLHKTYRFKKPVMLVGINSDAQRDVRAALKQRSEQQLDWEQVFEGSSGAPLTRDVFGFDKLPLQVLVDHEGYVRAVGELDDVEFAYAVRMAIDQAQGKAPVVRPRTVAGREAPPRVTKTTPAKEDEAEPGEPERESHPEARRLFNQARAFWKAGMKTKAKEVLEELLRKYPDSWEAAKAREMGMI